MAQKHSPPIRQEVVATCPGLRSSPTEVREWLEHYLEYRGLDPAGSAKFVWRGIELHRAPHANLLDAFKQHCGILYCEAEVLARDVHNIVERSTPPPKRTIFQVYVENLLGDEFYGNLTQWTKPNLGFFDQVNCVSYWLGFLIIHFVLSLICIVTIGFLMNT